MTQLAQTFAGSGPLYVTLFTELQTYPCTDNTWVGSENYYRALQDQYLAALAVFRQHAPNAKVSLGWGGWQARWDDPAKGGGRSLFPYFADVLAASDFQSFQAMERWFDRWEGWAVFLGRLTPVMRSFISIPAGVFRAELGPYVWLTLAGSASWCFALAGLGWAAGASWERVHEDFRFVEYAVALVVIGGLAWLGWRFVRRRRASPGEHV